MKSIRKTAAKPKQQIRNLPVPYRRTQRWMTLGLFAATGISAGVAIVAFDAPRHAADAAFAASSGLGLEVRSLAFKETPNVSRLDVYSAVLAANTNSMLWVDLEAIRQRLEQNRWVAQATVARRLPDTIEVKLIERRPFAYLQTSAEQVNQMALVDRTGHVMETATRRRFGDLPVVAGEGALDQFDTLVAMLDAAPRLRQQFVGAAWVGKRRWDVVFRTGEVLSLPEGGDAAKKAIVTFASLDAKRALLGQGFARFDMRIADKMAVKRAEQAVFAQPTDTSGETRI
jgi:cell division protein FtsQ